MLSIEKKKYWGLHIWARGYFVSTVGIDRDIIKQYVRNQQDAQMQKEELRIWKDSGE